MARCVGFTPKIKGSAENCANCKRCDGTKCLDKELLNELYEESISFNAFDHMMRGNRGISRPV